MSSHWLLLLHPHGPLYSPSAGDPASLPLLLFFLEWGCEGLALLLPGCELPEGGFPFKKDFPASHLQRTSTYTLGVQLGGPESLIVNLWRCSEASLRW